MSVDLKCDVLCLQFSIVSLLPIINHALFHLLHKFYFSSPPPPPPQLPTYIWRLVVHASIYGFSHVPVYLTIKESHYYGSILKCSERIGAIVIRVGKILKLQCLCRCIPEEVLDEDL